PVLRLAQTHLERKREEAEQTRLLYVSLTRARDHLVLPIPMDALGVGTAADALRGILGGLDLTQEGDAEWGLGDGTKVPVAVWPYHLDVDATVPPSSPEEPSRAPLKRHVTHAGPGSWSVTRLASLAFCPAYFAQSPVAPWPRPLQVDLYPDPPPVPEAGVVPAKDRGTVVHRWLEGVEGPQDLQTAPVPDGLEEDIEGLRDRLSRLIADPRLVPAFTAGPGLRHELALAMEHRGLHMSGAIDRLVLTSEPDGRVRALVVDFKTGATGYPGAGGRNPGYMAAYRFQLAAYALMLRGVFGDRLIDPVETALVFVDLEAVEFETWTHAGAEAEVGRVLGCLERPEQSAPNHQACPGCRMRDFCVSRES
ncbi:MAG: PD-(D/E)XK nuclease family protein, partial [Myxococcota bacterium]|nr:PD-(D/E)XK nuclease family protein [Myxococcota bacterium]